MHGDAGQCFDDRHSVLAAHYPGLLFCAGSCEPMLGPMNLRPYLRRGRLDWIMVGSDSAQHHRPFELDWCRDLMQQCRETGAAFFMKQVSGRFLKDDMNPR
jgi:protein gp37